MRAGNLRHLVRIERLEMVSDGGGGYSEEWQPVAEAWASVEALSGREFWQAQQVQSEATYRLRLRYREDVRPEDRIVLGDVVMNIQHAADPDGRRRELEIICKA